MEKKFEELVNDKCSWSYRSQIVCESNEINKLEQKSPYKQQKIIIETEISKNKHDDLQNNVTLDSSTTGENTGSSLHGYTNNSNKKAINKHLQNNNNKTQNISKNGKGKMLKKRHIRNVAKNPVQYLHQNPDRILDTNTETSTPSSSSMEILQTRFSHDKNNQNYILKELDNDSYSNISDKDTIQEIDANKKKSPIIIQAIPYREMEAIPVQTSKCSSEVLKINENDDKFKDYARQEILQHATKETELTCNDSLSIEANAPNSEINTSRDLSNASNNSEQQNLNSKNEVSCIQNVTKTIHPVPVNNLCDDPVNQDTENISNGQIIQDFFSGSLDISLYKSDDRELSEGRIEKRLIPNAACLNKKSAFSKKKNSSTNTKLSTKLMKNLSTIASEYNLMPLESRDDSLNKGDINNKGLSKKSNQKYAESESNSPINPKNNRKVKKRSKKNMKSKQPLRKKQTGNAYTEKLHNLMKNFNLNISKINFQTKLNIKNEKRNTSDSDSSVILVDDIGHDVINKEKNNLKTENQARNESFNTVKDSEKTVSPRKRNTRNSSIVASRKIKEIEKLGNSSDNDIIECTPVAKKLENEFLKKLDMNLQKNMNSRGLLSVKNENSMQHSKDKQGVNIIHNVFESPNTSNVSYNDTDIETSFAVDKSKMPKSLKNNRRNKIREHLLKNKNELHSLKSDKMLKQIDKNVSKHYTSFQDNNISKYDYLSSEDEEYQGTFHTVSEKANSKRKQKTDIYNIKGKNNNYGYSLNQDFKKKTRSGTRKNSTTKRKTWDDLESEILSDFDNKNTRNVSKTVILKKEKITRKGEDNNLFTVSNTSMMQTVSKVAKGDYNMEYKVQNLKRKYNCSDTNKEIYRYEENTFRNFQPKDVSKNMSILDKTIAAMDQCTALFLTPQESTWENRYLENLQSDEITNNSTPNTEDVEDQSKLKLFDNYNTKNNKLEQYTNEAVIPFYKTSNNPWNKFMKKLSLEDKKYECEKNCNDKNMDKSDDANDLLLLQEIMHENSNIDLEASQHQEKVEKCIKESDKQGMHEEQTCNLMSYTDRLTEGEFSKNNDEIQLLNEIRNNEIDYLLKEMKFNDIEEQNISGASNCSHHDNLKQDAPKETKICKIMTEVKSKRQNDDRGHAQESPNSSNRKKRKREDSLKRKKSFTLRLKEDGSLKFKKHSSKSSVSDISEDDSKKSVPKDNGNKEREKYIKYLKNVFQKENSHEDISNMQGSSKVEKLNNGSASDGNNLNDSINKASILIGKKDDDIFSLSSSDSDASVKEKTAGSGLFFDIFEEY